MPKHRKYTFTNNLKNIDTPEKAYWFGFIHADGSINNNGLNLEINKRDIEQIKNFNIFMQSTGVIRETAKDCVATGIYSTELSLELQSIGLIKNKSKVYQKVNIEYDLLRHYYRGLIDGDGWIVKHLNKKTLNHQYEIGLCCSHMEVIIDFEEYIKKELGVEKIGCRRKARTVNQIIIGGNNRFIKLVELLGYNEFYSMPRKLELINNGIKYINQDKLDRLSKKSH